MVMRQQYKYAYALYTKDQQIHPDKCIVQLHDDRIHQHRTDILENIHRHNVHKDKLYMKMQAFSEFPAKYSRQEIKK